MWFFGFSIHLWDGIELELSKNLLLFVWVAMYLVFVGFTVDK